VDFRLSLDFFDSGLYTCTAVARLTLALAKLSCIYIANKNKSDIIWVYTCGDEKVFDYNTAQSY